MANLTDINDAVVVVVILIPQRYLLTIMTFLAITNAYQMRVCLNVAITEMVYHEPKMAVGVFQVVNQTDTEICPDDPDSPSESELPPVCDDFTMLRTPIVVRLWDRNLRHGVSRGQVNQV